MYQQLDKAIKRLSDNAVIPRDQSNVDYQKFLIWEAQGNTPLPLPQESIKDLTEQKVQDIKIAADQAVSHLLFEYPEVEQKTFLKQEHQASLYIEWYEEGQQGNEPYTPAIQESAQERGLTLIEQSYRVRGKSQYFDKVANAVSAQRNKLHDQLMAAVNNDQLTDEQKREAIKSIDETSITCPPPPES